MSLELRRNVMKSLLLATLLLVVGCGSTPGGSALKDPYKEVNVETRDAEAKRVLTDSQGLILVYARGLCCPSCSLGVRKTLSRLSFVNTDAPKKGIILDAQHQLVHVMLKSDTKVISADIWQAVEDAGYDPVTIYTFTNGGLSTEHYQSK
jgi:hypothetical protein